MPITPVFSSLWAPSAEVDATRDARTATHGRARRDGLRRSGPGPVHGVRAAVDARRRDTTRERAPRLSPPHATQYGTKPEATPLPFSGRPSHTRHCAGAPGCVRATCAHPTPIIRRRETRYHAVRWRPLTPSLPLLRSTLRGASHYTPTPASRLRHQGARYMLTRGPLVAQRDTRGTPRFMRRDALGGMAVRCRGPGWELSHRLAWPAGAFALHRLAGLSRATEQRRPSLRSPVLRVAPLRVVKLALAAPRELGEPNEAVHLQLRHPDLLVGRRRRGGGRGGGRLGSFGPC